MTTRVEKLAAKLWACGTSVSPHDFAAQHATVQAAWITIARLAIRELKTPKRTKIKRKPKRPRVRLRLHPRSCRLDAHGKRVCS